MSDTKYYEDAYNEELHCKGTKKEQGMIKCSKYGGNCYDVCDHYPCNVVKAYEQGKADGKAEVLDEVIKKLAKSEDTMLSDKQYYALMELKGQK